MDTMTAETTPLCRNCHRPIGAGGADGLDARCYQGLRRHGTMPSPEVRGPPKEATVHVRLDEALAGLVNKAAKERGVSAVEWIRRACAKEVEGQGLARKRKRAS